MTTGTQRVARTLAIELGKFGVTANSVAPGFIETEMTRVTAQRLGISFDQLRQRYVARTAVGRVGQPADIAHLVSYLVSEGAGFVSGQVVYATGGRK
jgi:3-oxoacyl-[acyl-carrier protein] reductase